MGKVFEEEKTLREMNVGGKKLDGDAFAAAAEPLTVGLERVAVGFSGGADSTALLLLLADNAKRLGISVEAVHFEHGIRGAASLEDANWCRSFCAETYPALAEGKNIPFRVFHLDISADTPNIEAVARNARLEKWSDVVRGKRAAAALGHHADDRMETLMMRLLRGGNASSLAAPRISATIDGTRFIRPLLRFTRADIEEYLEKRGVRGWRRDATNEDVSIERNRVRREVLPAFLGGTPEKTAKGFLKSIAALEMDAEFIENEARKAFGRLGGGDGAALPTAETAGIHPAVRARLLRLWLSEVAGVEIVPSFDFLERLDDALERATATLDAGKIIVPLNGALQVAVSAADIRVGSNANAREPAPPTVWNWRDSPEISWGDWNFSAETAVRESSDSSLDDPSNATAVFNMDNFPETLAVRSRQPGDRMIPFGGDVPVRVKKLLESVGLHGADKETAPVVTAPDGTILWLPLARRSNYAPVLEKGGGGKTIVLKSNRPTPET